MQYGYDVVEAIGKAIRIYLETVDQRGHLPRSLDQSPFLPAEEPVDLVFSECLCPRFVTRLDDYHWVLNKLGREILDDPSDILWAQIEGIADLTAFKALRHKRDQYEALELAELIEMMREISDAQPKYRPILKRACKELQNFQDS